jgi:hypothetical protein
MPGGQARVGIYGSGKVRQWASAVLVPSFFSISHAGQDHSQPGPPGSPGSGMFER